MSPNVGNFIGDLVEMAKAYEAAPGLERRIKELESYNEAHRQVVAHREESILNLKAEIERLHEANRALEVARDEAQFRELEAQDRVDAAKRLLQGYAMDAGSFLKALEPPAPTPEPTPVAVAEQSSVNPAPQAITEAPAPAEATDPASAASAQGSTSAAPTSAYASDGAVSPGEASPVAQPDPTTAPAPIPSIGIGEAAGDAVSVTRSSTDSLYLPGEPRPMYDNPNSGPSLAWWNWYDAQNHETRDKVIWDANKR